MRIIAGTLRGRLLQAPRGTASRPTLDRVRQALFDRLWHAPWAGRAVVEGASVLDAFAGSGALGLEALSRGAARALFLDTSAAARAAIHANLAACRLAGSARVLAVDSTRPPMPLWESDLIFLDPPYGQGLVEAAIEALGRAGWIAPGSLLVVERGADEPPLMSAAPLALLDSWRQGPAQLSAYRSAAEIQPR